MKGHRWAINQEQCCALERSFAIAASYGCDRLCDTKGSNSRIGVKDQTQTRRKSRSQMASIVWSDRAVYTKRRGKSRAEDRVL